MREGGRGDGEREGGWREGEGGRGWIVVVYLFLEANDVYLPKNKETGERREGEGRRDEEGGRGGVDSTFSLRCVVCLIWEGIGEEIGRKDVYFSLLRLICLR